MSSLLARSRLAYGRHSNPSPFIAACNLPSPAKRSDSVFPDLAEQRGSFLKARAASSAKLPFDNFCLKRGVGQMELRWGFAAGFLVLILTTFLRGWQVVLSTSASKAFFAPRAMAQSAGASVPLIVVYITVPNKETASKLSSSLVSNKLAACVNQVPGIISTYMWEGKLETDEEILLIVKTRQSLLEALTVHVKASHPYTVPEVIALPILGGSESYVKWVIDNTLEHQSA